MSELIILAFGITQVYSEICFHSKKITHLLTEIFGMRELGTI